MIVPGALRATGRRVAVRLRGGTQINRAVVTLRTAKPLRLTGRAGAARVQTLARRGLTVAASTTRTHTLTLTPAGRRLLTRQGTVRVRVSIAPRGGATTHRVLTLRG